MGLILVPDQEKKSDIIPIFFNMKIYCVFALESPHRGDFNEYTQYTVFQYEKENHPNYPKSAAMDFFFKGFKNEFERAVVNEPSVFEPFKFYCTFKYTLKHCDCSMKKTKTKSFCSNF